MTRSWIAPLALVVSLGALLSAKIQSTVERNREEMLVSAVRVDEAAAWDRALNGQQELVYYKGRPPEFTKHR